jgi:hypothetical protein
MVSFYLNNATSLTSLKRATCLKLSLSRLQCPLPTLSHSSVGISFLTPPPTAVTQPGISFAVNKVSQFMHRLTSLHLQAVKWILRYLKSTLTFGLLLRKSPSRILQAYSDIDWAGCPNDRKSTGGFCVFLGPNLISWSSHKQRTVA